MNAKVLACSLAAVVVVLLVYSQFLQQRGQLLRYELAAEVAETNDLESVKSGLDLDIERAKHLQGEIAEELGLEEKNFHLLSETLANIEGRLRGVEKLRAAIGQLQAEYEGFKVDVEQYNLLRSRLRQP